MWKRIASINCFLLILLVSGNSLGQIHTNPTCPYHQNNYQSPMNIPLLLQQANIPIFQEPSVLQQPTNYNNLYSQPVSVQNQVTPCQNQPANILSGQTNQIPLTNQVNPITNQISQYYMQKILSNPSIQTILDQNGVLSQIGAEIPKQITNNIPNPGNVPNVINNYFILPPEFLKDIDNENPIHKRNPKAGERNNNRYMQDRKHYGRPNHELVESVVPIEDRRLRPKSQYTRRENNIKNIEFNEDMESLHSEENHFRPNRNRIENKFTSADQDNSNHRHTKLNTSLRRQNGKRVNNNHRRNEDPPSNSAERPKTTNRVKAISKEESLEDIRKENNHKKTIEIDENTRHVLNKKQKKSRDDAFIKDFRRKFPGIPEEVVRSLLSYLRKQLERQQLGRPRFFYPDVKFPLRYDQLFPNNKFTNQQSRPTNRRNSNKKHNKTNTSLNKNIIQETTEAKNKVPTTTEATLRDITIIVPKIKDISNVLAHDNVKTTLPFKFETTTEVQIPVLGNEDVLPTINNGIIDDYYPDFTKDKIYFESDEAYSVRSLRDNRYHYTTDRNQISWTKDNYKDDIENSAKKPYSVDKSEEEIIEFRTPPSLEAPDFRTKPIIRRMPYEKQDNVYFDKSSTYSDAKKSKGSDGKGYKHILNNKKPKIDDIETVYAHSKVVKYGKTEDTSAESATPVVTYYLPDNMQFEDDGKTIIVAKKISPDHFWQ